MHHDPARRTRAPRAVVVAIALNVIAVAAGGCQAAPPPPASAPSAPPASARGATEPASSPGASTLPAVSGIPAQEVSGSRAELAPGRYTRRGFAPRITFEVDGPWHSVNVFSGFFDVQQDVGSPDVIAVQFARPDGVYSGADQLVRPGSARAAADAVRANGSLEILGSSDSLMSGLSGVVVEVENPTTASAHVRVLQVPPGPLGIDPGRRLWIAFFDTPEGMLAILVGGSVEKWDEALTAAEPVLESVTIGR